MAMLTGLDAPGLIGSPKPARIDGLERKVFGMASGTVKWFNPDRGYGFIQPDGGGGHVFVHVSAVERSGLTNLSDGQKVSYELQMDARKGKESAVKLKTLS
jgi:CspA family cold shock protein